MNRRQSFLAGFTQTKPKTLAAGLLLALLVLGGAELTLRSFVFSRAPAGRFLVWTHDLWSYIPYRLGKIRSSPQRERVILLGSSALYHAYFGEAALTRSIKRVGGLEPPEVVTLHTPTQGMAETVQIIENLPRGRGLVLIATTAMRFRERSADVVKAARTSHLMLTSPTVARYAERHGERGWRFRFVLPAFVNYLRLYLPMNRKHLLAGKIPQWSVWPKREEAKQLAFVESAAVPSLTFTRESRPRLKPASLQHHLFERKQAYLESFELLAEAIQMARAKGYRVALFETPMNPKFRVSIPAKVEVITAFTRALAETEGIEYLDLAWTLGLTSEDFVDSVHLKSTSNGKLRYHYALARAIARLRPPAAPLLTQRGTP